MVFLNPPPSEEEIVLSYPPGYWWAPDPSSWKGRLSLLLLHALWWDVLALVRRHCPTGGSVLDVGCGSGIFLELLRRVGFQPRGIESSPVAVRLAQEKLGLPIRVGRLEEASPGIPVGGICLFHVLEHLPQPRRALLALRRMLGPEGRLILEVPNLNSWGRRMFQEHWTGWEIPRHLIHFTPETLTGMLRACGFEIVEMRLFSLRNSPAILYNSLLEKLQPGLLGTLPRNYLVLTLKAILYAACLPLALLESLSGTGEVILVAARRAR